MATGDNSFRTGTPLTAMPETPDFIPHVASAISGSTPDFIPHTEAPSGADALGQKGPSTAPSQAPDKPIMQQLSDFWGKLTAPVDPNTTDSNALVRGLSAAGGALMSVPGQIYHAAADPLTPEESADFQGHTRIPGEVTAERLTGARQLVGAAKTYMDPKTRPTMGQAKYVAPEAIGTGVGIQASGSFGDALNEVLGHPDIQAAAKTFADQGKAHAAIMKGKVSVANDFIRKPASALENAVMGDQGEVGQHANSVINQDEMDSRAKGNLSGSVDATPAVTAARGQLQKVMGSNVGSGPIEGYLQRATGPTSLRNLKALRTEVGKSAGKMWRAGNKGEASALYSFYDGLTDAGNARAQELGPQFSKSWQHYSDVTSSFKDMEKGVLGEMLDQNNHMTDMGQGNLINHVIANPTGLKEVTNSMSKYGVDPTPLSKAVTMGRSLNEAGEANAATFMGKMKAMIKHPAMIGAPVIAGSAIGHSMGLPAGIAGFALPIMIAYHLNGMIKRNQLATLMKEINKTTSDRSVTGELPDRMPLPQGGSTQGGQPPTPSTPLAPEPTPNYSGPEQRVGDRRQPDSAGIAFGGERRVQSRRVPKGTPADYIKTPRKLDMTEGEKLAADIKRIQAEKSGGGEMSEGEAMQQLMRDPDKWAQFKKLKQSGEKSNEKIADAMLVDVVKKRRAPAQASTRLDERDLMEPKQAKAQTVAKAKQAKDDAPNPTPDRRAIVQRGEHGQVTVEFPDAKHKELFSHSGRLDKQAVGKSSMKSDAGDLASQFGILQKNVYSVAKDYKKHVMESVKDRAKGTTYVAPTLEESLNEKERK